ncbi:MAG: hypothetical protein EYC70_04695 [Planctomycetota bacterium]|nr:MAG: hypothetical protein EYC70_04695 [Planctomycetota bacterium]
MRCAAAAALPLLLLAGAGCDRPHDPGPAPPADLPADWLQPVVQQHLEAAARHGLAEATPAQLAEIAPWLEALGAGGRVAVAARRELEQRDPATLAAAALGLLEARETGAAARRAAAAWLEAHPLEAATPRLSLRLKYEKDGVAAVAVARALLRLRSGAGLEALAQVLAAEAGSDDAARAAAAAALHLLPPHPDWRPGADFQADWQHLQRVLAVWNRERRLASAPSDQPDPGDDVSAPALAAEVWRMIARLDSQPLRPVDDARFVLTRMRCGVLPLLCAAARDQSLYVREHALETIAWIGAPAGRYALRTGFDLNGFFGQALAEPRTRMQALEALGACGLQELAPLAAPWLRSTSTEEVTAAADALLRCAGVDAIAALDEALARPERLSDEAHYALSLLRAELQGTPAAARPTLAATEKERRDRWREQRRERPGAPVAEG